MSDESNGVNVKETPVEVKETPVEVAENSSMVQESNTTASEVAEAGKLVYSDGHRVVKRAGDPTAGGAPARYTVGECNPKTPEDGALSFIEFQSAPIPDVGVEGVTNEALLAIVIDRLEHFQRGPFPSSYNADALVAARWALGHLEARTRDRQTRGVEGMNKS